MYYCVLHWYYYRNTPVYRDLVSSVIFIFIYKMSSTYGINPSIHIYTDIGLYRPKVYIYIF